MPRVTTKMRNRGGTKTYLCTGCGQPVEPGQKYYEWSRRFGMSGSTYRRHVKCGYPRPTELSSAKTAVVQEAIEVATDQINSWSVELTGIEDPDESISLEVGDIESALGDAASAAHEAAEEYEQGADAMPEALSYSPTAEAMREVAEELRGWATDVEQWSADIGEVELPDRDDGETDEEWQARCSEEVDDAVSAIRDSAIDAMSDLPSYGG